MQSLHTIEPYLSVDGLNFSKHNRLLVRRLGESH
ncbi:hypothetical protein BH09VER1_BH09VER1_31480 [soil metagenome]